MVLMSGSVEALGAWLAATLVSKVLFFLVLEIGALVAFYEFVLAVLYVVGLWETYLYFSYSEHVD